MGGFLAFACGEARAVAGVPSGKAGVQIACVGRALDIFKLFGAQLRAIARAEVVQTVSEVVILSRGGSRFLFPRT